jgi:non-canonical purine NTP pyrophosphatase (RdgB/HAM1 family)
MRKLVIASNNTGKLKEIGHLLEPLGFEVFSQSALGVTEPDEPHPTFIENALLKARHASLHTGLPALADDSGICVPRLSGKPGIHSARYAGGSRSDERNNQKLVETLRGESDRHAYATPKIHSRSLPTESGMARSYSSPEAREDSVTTHIFFFPDWARPLQSFRWSKKTG